MNLTEEQIRRYSRQIILKDVGGKGQEKLLQSSVLIVGVGGLGSPAALYLAAAGVGTLGLVDGDKADLTNLHRQVAHFTEDIGREKVESAAAKLRKLNPGIRIVTRNSKLSAESALAVVRDYDFIIDGTDNFSAKFLINDACVMAGRAFSHAGILGFDGLSITHVPGSACYRCIVESPPPAGMVPSCSQAGVIGPVAGLFGMVQAAEAIKYCIGIGELLTNRILSVDLLTMNFETLQVQRNPACPVCGENPVISELNEYEHPVCEMQPNGEVK